MIHFDGLGKTQQASHCLVEQQLESRLCAAAAVDPDLGNCPLGLSPFPCAGDHGLDDRRFDDRCLDDRGGVLDLVSCSGHHEILPVIAQSGRAFGLANACDRVAVGIFPMGDRKHPGLAGR